MKIAYEFFESKIHGYQGIEVPNPFITSHFPKEVNEKLNDFEGSKELTEIFSTSIPLTGFDINVVLLDIFSIENTPSEWRIGEAFAEFYLESQKGARFYWNEIRDQRNIDSNKTGADLVGFVEMSGVTVFLFGEVKTSNDAKRPPEVLYGKSGMIKQLEDLAIDQRKVNTLIRYLGTKVVLYPLTHPFRIDYVKALKSYLSDMNQYNLFGILVRDLLPHESDIKPRYKALKKLINIATGLQLIALYIPVKQNKWSELVNGTNE